MYVPSTKYALNFVLLYKGSKISLFLCRDLDFLFRTYGLSGTAGQ